MLLIVREGFFMRKLALLLLAAFAVVTFVLPASPAEARMCFRCDGKGYIETYEYDTKTPNYSGGSRKPGYTKRETCPSCGGRGYKD